MNNLFPFESKISNLQRKERMEQEPKLVWFTGLSGSGKSTLALRLEHYFFHRGYKVFLLDGDNVRNGLNKDLGFSETDRKENLRRVSEMAKLMLDAGLLVICAFIAPYEEERQLVRSIIGEDRYLQVYVNASLEVCEKRDPKGLYAKARLGLIPHFTGISSPYETPVTSDLEVKTAEETIEESLLKIIHFVEPLVKLQENRTAISPTSA